MNILKNWRHKILFGYYSYPAFGYPEREDAGFSMRLFAGGTILYQTYSLDSKSLPVIKTSCRVTLGERAVSRITRIIAGYAKEIDALPEYTNNGSCDGAFNDFVFCGKYVSSLNIRRTDVMDVIHGDREYFENFRFDMADENTILDIFTMITASMRDDGVQLYLYHLLVGGDRIC